MYCRHCGTQISDEANFCFNCGGNNQPQMDVQQPEVTLDEPKVSIAKSIKSLVFGIIGVDFATISLVFLIEFFALFTIYVGTEDVGAIIAFAIIFLPFSIIGLCFSNAAKSNSDEFCALAGQPNGLSKVGRVMGIVGRILNLVGIIVYALFGSIAMFQ